MDAIAAAIKKIDYGQIVIKIQDGQVILIDSLERKRLGKFRMPSGEMPEYTI